MISTVFGVKVRMSGLCINRYRPIVRLRLSAIALSVHLYLICLCTICSFSTLILLVGSF